MDQHSTSPASTDDLSPGSPRKPVEAAEGAPAVLQPSRTAGAFPETMHLGVDTGGQDYFLLQISSTIPSQAIIDVLGERVQQIAKFGHTPALDAGKSITTMHNVVWRYTHGLSDTVSAHGARSTMRAYAVRAAAALLAFIDRLDAEEAANG